MSVLDQAIRYVATYGDDSDNGLSWQTAMGSIEHAVSTLPIYVPGSGHQRHRGKVFVGAGIFEPKSPVLFAQDLQIEGMGANITTVKMFDGFNQHLFQVNPLYTHAWNHFFVLRGLKLDGNKKNQEGYEVARIFDALSVNPLVFTSLENKIIRAEGSWADDGYVPGIKIRVHAVPLNEGVFTVKGVTDKELAVVEAIVDEGPVFGAGVHAAPFDLVNLDAGGFGTYFDNVLFYKAPAYGTTLNANAVTFNLNQCMGAHCEQGFFRGRLTRSANLCNISFSGATQIDHCGPAPIYIESHSHGGSNLIHIENLEAESNYVGVHDAVVRLNRVAGNNNPYFRIDCLNAWKRETTGAGMALVHEMKGAAGHWDLRTVLAGGGVKSYKAILRTEPSWHYPDGKEVTAYRKYHGFPIVFGNQSGRRSMIQLGSIQLWSGPQTPNLVKTYAPPGSRFFPEDGGPEWVKESGTEDTGWVQKT